MIYKINKMWNEIAKERKAAFFSALIIGLIVHLFMITNKIPNHDDAGQLYDSMNRIASGRWFLKVPAALSGKLSITFGAVLGIVYIAVGAYFVITVLKIKNTLCSILIAAIMVVFPTITCTLFYMNSQDGYFFALMLACMGVYFGEKEKIYHWLLAVILLTLSLGIYQAYFPFAVVLFVAVYIVKCLFEEYSFKDVLEGGIKAIIILALALVCYMLIVKVYVASGLQLSTYKGIDEMGQITLNEIPSLIVKAYKSSINFFVANDKKVHYSFMNKCFIISILITLVGTFLLVKKGKFGESKAWRYIVVLVAYGVMPLAAGLIYIMSKDLVHMLMVYGFVIYLIMPIVIVDIYTQKLEKMTLKKVILRVGEVCETIVLLTIVIAIFNYAIIANQCYLYQKITYEQSYAQSAILMTRITDLEGYSKSDTIVFVGTTEIDTNIVMPWKNETRLQYMMGKIDSFINVNAYKSFLKYYMGIENQILRVSTEAELVELIDDISSVSEAEVYPNGEALIDFGEYIVVKFSELK